MISHGQALMKARCQAVMLTLTKKKKKNSIEVTLKGTELVISIKSRPYIIGCVGKMTKAANLKRK